MSAPREAGARVHNLPDDARRVKVGWAELGYWVDPERRRRGRPSLAALRVHDLSHLYRHRYGETLPDDDAGRDDLLILAHHLAGLPGDLTRHLGAWASLRAPWLTDTEAADLAERVGTAPLRWHADTLAWRLGLTMAERTALGITTIGAIDCNKAEREAARRARRRAADLARRQMRGATPRAASASQTRPWEAFGTSRRTWERRGKPVPK